mgnify:CR=1 FL=1
MSTSVSKTARHRVRTDEWLSRSLVTLKTGHRPSGGRCLSAWVDIMRLRPSSLLLACLILGCGKVQINDQGYTGTWSDMGSGTIDPTNGPSSGSDASDGDVTDAGLSGDALIHGDGAASGCEDVSDCMLSEIPGCVPACVDGECTDRCETTVPDQPPFCGRRNTCDDLCVYLARCSGSFCVTEAARDYRSIFSVCRETLCDASPILCEQSTCELFVAFARDLSQPFRQLCTGR